jgi:small subunit ribosomal protein S18
MAAGKRRQGGDSPAPARPGQRRKVFERRRRSCYFCKEKIAEIDYKSVSQLRRFISERGKIRGRGNTGTCRKHQRQVAIAIKRAREMALLPYVNDRQEQRQETDRPRGRGAR